MVRLKLRRRGRVPAWVCSLQRRATNVSAAVAQRCVPVGSVEAGGTVDQKKYEWGGPEDGRWLIYHGTASRGLAGSEDLQRRATDDGVA